MDERRERRLVTQNRILRALPPDDFGRISHHAAFVPLDRGHVISDTVIGNGRVHFMLSGACSAVLTTTSGQRIEVASIGCDGVTSAFQAGELGLDLQVIVTVAPATAMRLTVLDFDTEMDRRGALRELVTQYYRTLRYEIMLAVSCNRFHSARARYCKQLLTLADRIGSDTIHVTQTTLALMLGMTRPSVTLTAIALRRLGIIDYGRDSVVIVDRRELERGACECYRVIRNLSAPDRASGT